MDPNVSKSLLKVVAPLATIALIAVVSKVRRFTTKDLGLVAPSPAKFAMWVSIYLALMLGSNAFMDWRGPWDFTIWREQGVFVAVLRVLAVGILGPIGEELLFRGLLQFLIARSRLGTAASIVLPALVWAGIHYMYSPGVIALLFVAGLLLGAARHHTKSLYTPIAMHILWNLYAIW